MVGGLLFARIASLNTLLVDWAPDGASGMKNSPMVAGSRQADDHMMMRIAVDTVTRLWYTRVNDSDIEVYKAKKAIGVIF